MANNSKQEILDLLENTALTGKEIADRIRVSEAYVSMVKISNGVTRSRKRIEFRCECGETFTGYGNRKYCSKWCQYHFSRKWKT